MDGKERSVVSKVRLSEGGKELLDGACPRRLNGVRVSYSQLRSDRQNSRPNMVQQTSVAFNELR